MSGEMVFVRIDFTRSTGRLKGLHQHFCGGGPELLGPERQGAYFAAIGASLLRIWLLQPPHFFLGQTLEDARNPGKYDFSTIDAFATRADALGLELFPTLATTPPQLSVDGSSFGPPKDLDVYKEVIRHVILHLTQGWADGHQFRIPYWEVWNEPDIADAPGPLAGYFWTGSRQQYFDLYAALARMVKSIVPVPGHPPYKIGGPALCLVNDGAWAEPFLEYCDAHALPLDFFSFHKYHDEPEAFARLIDKFHGMLGKFPRFRDTELVLNEWNMKAPFETISSEGKSVRQYVFDVMGHPKYGYPESAVHHVRSLILMERSPLSKAGHYTLADNGKSQMGIMTFPEIVFPPEEGIATPASGAVEPCILKPVYHALRAFQMLYETPELAHMAIGGTEIDGLAGISNEKDYTTVLLANWGTSRQIRVEIGGLALQPRDAKHTVSRTWNVLVFDPNTNCENDPLCKISSGSSSPECAIIDIELPHDAIGIIRLRVV